MQKFNLLVTDNDTWNKWPTNIAETIHLQICKSHVKNNIPGFFIGQLTKLTPNQTLEVVTSLFKVYINLQNI